VLTLQVSAPFATFTRSHSREYLASFLYPPPSTVYGMMLSLVGETDPARHRGVKLAIGMLSTPLPSVVIRRFHRRKKVEPTSPKNVRPDFQEVLGGLEIAVCLDSTDDPNNLEERVHQALTQSETVARFGGLSLGESRDLVNDLRLLKSPPKAEWLVPDERGTITLPVVVDYLGSEATRWLSFSLGDFSDRCFAPVV
jgi:CRISPR-associated protein Cas5t